MDIENLIEELRARRPVWDSGDKNYNNRNFLDKLWNEISAETGYSVSECKKKWKYLRDRFRLELKKLAASKSDAGSTEYQQSTWAYFDQMLFVKNHMLGYKEVDTEEDKRLYYKMNSLLELSEAENSDNDTSGTDVEEKTIADPLNDLADKRPLRKRTRTIISAAEKLLELKQKQAAFLCKKIRMKESDDLLFFKSLLGFMKDFTPVQRLRVRDKIQKVILHEMAPNDKTSWPTSSFVLESSNSN